jgi:hypothetical protein
MMIDQIFLNLMNVYLLKKNHLMMRNLILNSPFLQHFYLIFLIEFLHYHHHHHHHHHHPIQILSHQLKLSFTKKIKQNIFKTKT